MTNKEKLQKLYAVLDEAEIYARTLGKLNFDMQCCAPEEGMDRAGKDIAALGQKYFELTHSPEFTSLLCELHEDAEGLSDLEKASVERYFEDYEKTKNFTPEFAYELSAAENEAFAKWLTAKEQKDFSMYRDSMAKLIELSRKAVSLRDKKEGTTYDALLSDYEKGGSIAQLDAFFAALKERIIPLVKRICTEGKSIRTDFLSRPCPVAKQEEFSRYLLRCEGLREKALVLMTSEHPFTTNFGASDVRVTTHYYEENFVSNIFSTLHEGGHALFMQNEPSEFHDLHLADNMSNAMHECISRFFENIVGRSEEFISFVYPEFQKLSEGRFSDVSERELYEAVNVASPSLIRMEADELTYSIHILIRYEMEKAFVNGEISVDEIPAKWNEKYREYLGVEVPDDAMGCLQDVHWTGSFGYFPSYALGNAYGVQILRTMEKEFDVWGAIRSGELFKLRDWLVKNVFSCASILTPDEWINKITGESLDPNYFLDYLEEKFTKLYELK